MHKQPLKMKLSSYREFIEQIGELAVLKILKERGDLVVRRKYKNKFGNISLITLTNKGIIQFCKIKTLCPQEEYSDETVSTEMISWYLTQTCKLSYPWKTQYVTVNLDTNKNVKSIYFTKE